jgi:hypothetical protein
MQILGSRPWQNDRLLAHDEEPPVGSHLVTPRFGFAHHGIYVGEGKVVHYGSLGNGRLRGPVEEVPVANFSRGHTTSVRCHERARFDSAEVIRRARSRVGENRYRVLSNNCEHFCEWCLQGEHFSYQVDCLLALPRRLRRMISAVVNRLSAIPLLHIRVASDPVSAHGRVQ